MKYGRVVRAEFIDRPNRFVANVILDGERLAVHVKNTGRCGELLVPGAEVYLEDCGTSTGRKYRYDLIAVNKGGLLINMDSQSPNKAVHEAIVSGRIVFPGFSDLDEVKPEKVYGDSRFDFYLRSKSGGEGFCEVKGVTLEEGGVVSFPDAPTERGIKHLCELVKAKGEGYTAFILFVVQMSGARYFTPNDERHREFGETLRYAASHGVEVIARECAVTPDSMLIAGEIPVKL